MLERQSKDETAIILYKDKDIYQPLHIKEVGIVVNRLVNVFNEIGVDIPLFDSEIELPHTLSLRSSFLMVLFILSASGLSLGLPVSVMLMRILCWCRTSI